MAELAPADARQSPHYVKRFGRTERALHWVHATAFFVLLASGLVLWLPQLSVWVGRRTLVKDVHLYTAVAWGVAIVLIVVFGNRRALTAIWREVETIDRDDRRWLTLRKAPQGRFNAGQKLNVIVTTAFAILFAVSGVLLWLAARDARFRWGGPIVVHDVLTVASVLVVSGHLYLALIHPTTRHALRGMTRGDVRADWAERHHPKWRPEEAPPDEVAPS